MEELGISQAILEKKLTISRTERTASHHLSHTTTRQNGDSTNRQFNAVFQDADLPNLLRKTEDS